MEMKMRRGVQSRIKKNSFSTRQLDCGRLCPCLANHPICHQKKMFLAPNTRERFFTAPGSITAPSRIHHYICPFIFLYFILYTLVYFILSVVDSISAGLLKIHDAAIIWCSIRHSPLPEITLQGKRLNFRYCRGFATRHSNQFSGTDSAVRVTAIQTRIPQPRLKSPTQRYLTVRPDISGGLAPGPKGLDDTEGSLQY
jgi:hypothetical protein